ncbi:hypothetical protein ACI65C_012624 [Semiaphis heraclei]
MVNFCSAFNCSSSSDVENELIFHKFPLNDSERLKKWIYAVRRINFKPTRNSILCSLHFTENDYNKAVVSGKLVLKKCAVPTIFKFPDHLMPKVKERRILQRSVEIQNKLEPVQNSTNASDSTKRMFVDVGVQTKQTGEDLDKIIHDLRREKKILQQKLMRRINREKFWDEDTNP